MDYGAKMLKWAPFSGENPEQAGKLPTYGTAKEIGTLNKVSDAPAFNEAKGYGNNRLVVYVNKFKEDVVSVEVTEIPRELMSSIAGTEIEEGTHANMRFKTTDRPPYGGMGFFVNKALDDGSIVYMGVFFPKVKVMLQGTEYNTDGENITLATEKLQFTASAVKTNDWKIESPYFDDEEKVIAWVDGMFTGESTDIGKTSGSQGGSQGGGGQGGGEEEESV